VCPDAYARIATLTAVVVGLLHVAISVLRLRFMLSFLGHAVSSGFTAGASTLIILSQLKYVLAIDMPKSLAIQDILSSVAQHIGQTNITTLLISLLWIVVLLVCKTLGQRYLRISLIGPLCPLFLCIVSTLLVGLWPTFRKQQSIDYIGQDHNLRGYIPSMAFTWKLEWIPRVIPTALTICLMGYTESIAIGRALSAKHGYEIEAGQELVAFGYSNVFGGLFGGFPVSASRSRSFASSSMGASTQLTSIITSLVVFVLISFVPPLFFYLPKFALAAVVVVSVMPLLTFVEAFHLCKVSSIDSLLWLFAFIGTVFAGADIGVAIAAGLSLLVLLQESMKPPVSILWQLSDTNIYRSMNQETAGRFIKNVLICRLVSSLHFANMSYAKEMLINCVASLEDVNRTEYLVLEMTEVTGIDSTAIHTILDIVGDFRRRGIQIGFAMLCGNVDKVLRKARFKAMIGEHWFFHTVQDAVTYCLCHQQAKRIREMNMLEEEMRRAEIAAHDQFVDRFGTAVGFNNDLHTSCTIIFLTLAAEVPMSEVTAVFNNCQIHIVRAQIEPLRADDAVKHTYFLQTSGSHKKLSDADMVKLQEEFEALLRQYRDRPRSPFCTLKGAAATMFPTGETSIMASEQTGRLERLEKALDEQAKSNLLLKETLRSQAERIEQLLLLQEDMILANVARSSGATAKASAGTSPCSGISPRSIPSPRTTTTTLNAGLSPRSSLSNSPFHLSFNEGTMVDL